MNKFFNQTIMTGVLGNALECYEFTLYASFSPILAQLFFPIASSVVSLLLTFSIFALSFLVRPFAGILFGYLGDHIGRKNALVISSILMAFSTLFLGLLPSYTAIGIGAPLLLTLLRLTQGIAVSGELATAISFLVEHAHTEHRGFVGSLVICSGVGGSALSAAIIALLTAMISHQALVDWGWRLPFILGGLLNLFTLKVRLQSQETLIYQQSKKIFTQSQKISILKHYSQIKYKPVLFAILLTCIMPMSYYFLIAYFNAFAIKEMNYAITPVMIINFICQLLLTFLLPIFGNMSDKMGRKPILMASLIGMIVLIHLIFWLAQQHNLFLFFFSQFIFVLISAPFIANIPTTLAEMFPVFCRNSSVSLSYNISQAMFGGTAPLLAVSLIAFTQNLYAPAWYLLIGACVSLFSLINVKETYQQPLA